MAASTKRFAPREVIQYLAEIALVFIAYFVAGKLSLVLPSLSGGRIGPILPASGVALAAVLIFGDRVWPGIMTGAFFVALSLPVSPNAAFIHGTGVTVAALTGSFLLRHIVNFKLSMPRLRDALGLIVFGAFASSVVNASIGPLVIYPPVVRGWSGFGKAWIIEWLGNSIGVLLVTPLLLSFANLRRSPIRSRVPELVALLLFLVASCFIVNGDLPLITVRLHFLAFALLPFVLWAAIRFGMTGVTLSTLVIAGIALVGTRFGSGPFTQNSPFVNTLLLDVLFVVLSVSGLTLAAITVEWEQAEKEREEIVRDRVVMQERLRLATIVESSDDAIIGKDLNGVVTNWNKGAERIYGYTADEMIGKKISLLAPPDHAIDSEEIISRIKQGVGVKHFETQRLKKDGTRIDVSLTASAMLDAEGRIVGVSVIARDISEHKHQEAVLRESEERFRLVADTTPAMIWMSDADNVTTFANKAWLDFSGRSLQAELESSWTEGIHPDDLERSFNIYSQALDRREAFRMEYRLLRRDGEYRWILDIGVPRFNQDGSFAGFVGSGVDVTESKMAAEVLASVSRRLIEAQELDRTRIAREIHDDIGQRLALLSVEIQQMRELVPEAAVELGNRMRELEKRTQEISKDAQTLSHELHSSRLEYLGIVAAMKSFCKEFGDKHSVEVVFDNAGIPRIVPPDISVCLFRILQESLHNALKHSGVRHFEVKLEGEPTEIHLAVRDWGIGFDPDAPRTTEGLGLVSMEERVKLVKGTISIISRAHSGTVVIVRVPLPTGSQADQAKLAGA
ncbi:MAG TPA: PAS domain S-box protein [Candidatus Acidoferrales bacterium]